MNKRKKKKHEKVQSNNLLRTAAQVEADMNGYENLQAPTDMYDRIVKKLRSRGNTFN